MIDAYRAKVEAFLGVDALAAAQAHALAEYPKESCGFIAGGVYVACKNVAKDPLTRFAIDDPRYQSAMVAGDVAAIVHSHPNGPMYPSHADMAQQIVTDVPWVIISCNETDVGSVIAWGDELPVAPVIARPFVHGVFDCYSLFRDVFRLGRDELAKQDVHWPLPPIALREVARDDNWWQSGQDLYTANFAKFGFRVISRSEAQPGDGFLIAMGDRRTNPDNRLNHAGVLLEHDQILHHFPTKPSLRVPAGLWARAADLWIRYEGPER